MAGDPGRVPADAVPALTLAGYEALVAASATGMAVNALDGRFIAANPTLCELLGYTQDELSSLDFPTLTHPEDRAASRTHHQRLLSGDVPSYRLEKRYVARSGRVVWARTNVALIRDERGEPAFTSATVEDVSGVREAAERLELMQSLLRVAGGLALVGGWAITFPEREVTWTEEIYSILDVAPGPAIPVEEGLAMYGPEDRERLASAIDRCARDGTPFDLRLRVTTHAGRSLVVRIVGEAEYDAAGQVCRLVGAFQDVSELVGAHERADAVETRLTEALENMTDAFFVLDRDWRFGYVNPRAEQLLRHSADDLVGQDLWERFPDAVDTEFSTAYRDAMDSGEPRTLEEVHFPPLGAWFEVHAYPSPHGLAVYFRDVTAERERKVQSRRHEAKLREQAALLDESQDAILVRDLDGVVTYWNAAAEHVYGWSADEAVGRPFARLVEEDDHAIEEATRRLLADGAWSGELRSRSRDGDELILAARWSLLRDDEDRPHSILATATDVTDRRRVEQQLLRAQRLESIGTLAGGIAHDLNNVLSPVLLSLELLSAGEQDPRRLELLRTVETSTRRGAAMIKQVLAFARGVSGVRVDVDIGEVLGDALRIVRETFPRNICIDEELVDPLPSVCADPTQLHQVVMNLLVNARDALPSGGTIRCRTSLDVIDEQYAAVTADAEPGRHVVVEIEDDGSGMAPGVLDRIFEPFFTTKEQGEGTGLGLSTSLAIVRSHGGHVRVYSEPGVGTTFRVGLPVAVSTGDPAPHESGDELPRGRGELVLVVDDEDAVLQVTSDTLETFGYRVAMARDGADAVARFVEDPGAFGLVLTDVMMPIMDGVATIHALRRIRPDVPIVASSGLGANGAASPAAPWGAQAFLPKPCTASLLLTTLRRVLDGDAGGGEDGPSTSEGGRER